MKIKGFLTTSFSDWDGKVSSVIFLPRCNFRCPMCHNHQLVSNPDSLPTVRKNDVVKWLTAKRDFIDGVVVTGGEPTVHKDLEDLLKELKDLGFDVKLDTNGSHPLILEYLIEQELVDYIAMDIKAPLDPQKYSELAGVKVDIRKIGQSIGVIMSFGIDYEFRTTVPPTLTKQDVFNIAREIEGAKKYVLQRFIPDNALSPEYRKLKPYTEAQLKEMAEICRLVLKNVKVR